MGLQQVATNTVSSTVSSVTLTGINDDSIYMVSINNATFASDKVLYFRFTESGSANSTNNYDRAGKGIRAGSSFYNNSATNANVGYIDASRLENSTGANAILFLYNANDSSDFTYVNNQSVGERESNQGLTVTGLIGGQVFTVNSQVDGIAFMLESSENFTGGTFTLWKLI